MASRSRPLALRWSSQVVLEQLDADDRDRICSFVDAREVGAARDDPAIVHRTGARKPWNDPAVRHGAARWRALAGSAFRDQTPEPSPRSVVRGGNGRRRRAAATILNG